MILADPDDDAVLACALAAQSEVITSGDNHLLDLKEHQEIRILQRLIYWQSFRYELRTQVSPLARG